jgi:hypothetical protein
VRAFGQDVQDEHQVKERRIEESFSLRRDPPSDQKRMPPAAF